MAMHGWHAVVMGHCQWCIGAVSEWSLVAVCLVIAIASLEGLILVVPWPVILNRPLRDKHRQTTDLDGVAEDPFVEPISQSFLY